MFAVINRNNLQILMLTSSTAWDKSIFSEQYLMAEIPESFDPETVKVDSLSSEQIEVIDVPEVRDPDTDTVITPAVTHMEIKYTVVFAIDNGKVFDKIQAQKQAQIDAINNNTWNTILTQAQSVYDLSSISDRNEASILILATHSTYESMVNNPAAYVGDLFPNTEAVLGYAQPKLSASLAFGKWRMGILAAEKVQKDAILNS